jgi:hypothetical protein
LGHASYVGMLRQIYTPTAAAPRGY